MADTEGTGLNVSLTQNVIFAATGGITPPPPPPPPSPGGGGSVSPPPPLPPPPAPTFGVVFTGLAFPESRVDILGYSLDNIAHGVLLDQSRVSATGEFSLNLNDPKLKSPFYVLSLTDKESVTGQYKIFVNLPDFNTLQDIIFAPTISLLRSSIRHGDFIVVKGYANPGSSIEAEIDGEVLAGSKALASADGSYSMIIPTAGMQLGKHFVRVRQILTDFRVSEFSVTKSFTLSNIFRPENTDLNDDGAVDIRDVNIFLSSWLSSNPEVRLKNDFNRDGVLDIQDLSIFAQSLRR